MHAHCPDSAWDLLNAPLHSGDIAVLWIEDHPEADWKSIVGGLRRAGLKVLFGMDLNRVEPRRFLASTLDTKYDAARLVCGGLNGLWVSAYPGALAAPHGEVMRDFEAVLPPGTLLVAEPLESRKPDPAFMRRSRVSIAAISCSSPDRVSVERRKAMGGCRLALRCLRPLDRAAVRELEEQGIYDYIEYKEAEDGKR